MSKKDVLENRPRVFFVADEVSVLQLRRRGGAQVDGRKLVVLGVQSLVQVVCPKAAVGRLDHDGHVAAREALRAAPQHQVVSPLACSTIAAIYDV